MSRKAAFHRLCLDNTLCPCFIRLCKCEELSLRQDLHFLRDRVSKNAGQTAGLRFYTHNGQSLKQAGHHKYIHRLQIIFRPIHITAKQHHLRNAKRLGFLLRLFEILALAAKQKPCLWLLLQDCFKDAEKPGMIFLLAETA